MLTEENPRQRIENENPGAVKLLDFLATRIRPFTDGKGWTVFNDWLDNCYSKKSVERRPPEIPFVSLDDLRAIVFPKCRLPH